MADFSLIAKNLEARGFSVKTIETAAEAAAYLNGTIDGVSVGIGGSKTAEQLGLYDSLKAHNDVVWHWKGDQREAAMATDVYISSVNAAAETGELINIDGAGNRVAGTLYGHKKVCLVVGANKLAPTYDEALWRARNVAAPLRAKELNRKTPCAVNADRCYDCRSPERICRGLVVLWGPVMGVETEVVLINEDLGN